MQIYNWDKAGFESAYWRYFYKLRGCGAGRAKWCQCNDTYISYSRNFFDTFAIFEMRASKIKNLLPLPVGSSVLVVGCALGFLNEELTKLGMTTVGCDNSNYINGLKNKEKVTTDVENLSVIENNFVPRIKTATGRTSFDCIITEDVMPSHDSYNTIFSNCESLLTPGKPLKNIVHIVDTNVTEPFVKKTIDEWKQLNSNHTWLNSLGD